MESKVVACLQKSPCRDWFFLVARRLPPYFYSTVTEEMYYKNITVFSFNSLWMLFSQNNITLSLWARNLPYNKIRSLFQSIYWSFLGISGICSYIIHNLVYKTPLNHGDVQFFWLFKVFHDYKNISIEFFCKNVRLSCFNKSLYECQISSSEMWGNTTQYTFISFN